MPNHNVCAHIKITPNNPCGWTHRAQCFCFPRHVLTVRDFVGPCIIICYVRTLMSCDRCTEVAQIEHRPRFANSTYKHSTQYYNFKSLNSATARHRLTQRKRAHPRIGSFRIAAEPTGDYIATIPSHYQTHFLLPSTVLTLTLTLTLKYSFSSDRQREVLWGGFTMKGFRIWGLTLGSSDWRQASCYCANLPALNTEYNFVTLW